MTPTNKLAKKDNLTMFETTFVKFLDLTARESQMSTPQSLFLKLLTPKNLRNLDLFLREKFRCKIF